MIISFIISDNVGLFMFIYPFPVKYSLLWLSSKSRCSGEPVDHSSGGDS